MKLRLFIVIAILLAISSFAYSKDKKGHYFDADGKHLPQYDYIFDGLTKFFNKSVPDKITIIYTNEITSQFNAMNESVLINEASVKNGPNQVIGHESCHLSMANFTNGASVKEEFRFFDEGFASIYEHMLANDSGDYKKISLKIAVQQNRQENVTFTKVQKWSEYFGDPKKFTNYYAYPVGSSFVYYVIDSYGMDCFLAFCKKNWGYK